MKPNIYQDLEEVADVLAVDGETRAYNQAAFGYFMDLERKRSERTNRPFTLLLAKFGPELGADSRMDRDVAAHVLSGLRGCLRDTDFVGWYLHDKVAGAVLTERTPSRDETAHSRVRERVVNALTDRLPKGVAGHLQVRVYQQLPVTGRES